MGAIVESPLGRKFVGTFLGVHGWYVSGHSVPSPKPPRAWPDITQGVTVAGRALSLSVTKPVLPDRHSHYVRPVSIPKPPVTWPDKLGAVENGRAIFRGEGTRPVARWLASAWSGKQGPLVLG
jgi:hypothetical protein